MMRFRCISNPASASSRPMSWTETDPYNSSESVLTRRSKPRGPIREHSGERPRGLQILDLLDRPGLSRVSDLAPVLLGDGNGDPARQEVVPRVTGADIHFIAGLTEGVHGLSQ